MPFSPSVFLIDATDHLQKAESNAVSMGIPFYILGFYVSQVLTTIYGGFDGEVRISK